MSDAAGCRFRTVAELLRAMRDQHLLTQAELAERCGLDRAQLCRYEKGTVEPSLRTLRRLLEATGWAPTFGLEPTTAALDERLDGGGQLWSTLGVDTWLVLRRVVWPALDRQVPLVVGGELAAGLQGVPIIDPDMVLHLRLPHLAAFAAVVREAHCVLGKPGPVGLYDEPEEPAPEDELVVYAGSGTLRLRISDALPATAVVRVGRRLDDEDDTIAVPVVELAVLRGSSVLGPAAEALAARIVARR